MPTLIEEIAAKLGALPDDEKRMAIRDAGRATKGQKWFPQPGPQTEAYFSAADVLLYGGQAGGGKSDLLLGLALTAHRRSLIVRRQYTDLSALTERAIEINGTRQGFNGSSPPTLRADGRLVEFGACKTLGDEQSWQGRPHDLLGLEEGAQLLSQQARFLMGWVRTTDPSQRTRIVIASNPPLSDEGQWLFEMFRPWLDPAYPRPAKPGELRWFVTDPDGRDLEVDGPSPVAMGQKADGTPRLLTPLSRTFIPAKVSDNAFIGREYIAKLDALPEPLRSAIRDGSFLAGRQDAAWQLIPSQWIFAAQSRWTQEPPAHAPMCSMGVDVAQGGTDQTVIACRYDAWFAPLIAVKGADTPFGSDVAGLVVKHRRNKAVVVIDMGGGYGGGAYEHLKANDIPVYGFKGADAAVGMTKDRQRRFVNKRSEAWWRFREALDPDQEGGSPVALPYDSELIADLVSAHYEDTARGLKVETKEDIVKRLGRSPDRGDAVVMAWSEGATAPTHGQIWRDALKRGHRPKLIRGHEAQRRR